ATLGLADQSTHHAMWVHRFPMFERTAEGGWTFSHNPFAGPLTAEDASLMETDPGKARSSQYDLVIDGNELGGGSIRIHNRALQERALEILGVPRMEAPPGSVPRLMVLDYAPPREAGFGAGLEW